MKLKTRDLLATILVALIAIPYVAYLVNGDLPFIKDPRGMSALGLVLGAAAFLVLWPSETHDRAGTTENVMAASSGVIGVITLLLAETAAAEVLLAVFMVTILVVWAVIEADRAGFIHAGHQPARLQHQ